MVGTNSSNSSQVTDGEESAGKIIWLWQHTEEGFKLELYKAVFQVPQKWCHKI